MSGQPFLARVHTLRRDRLVGVEPVGEDGMHGLWPMWAGTELPRVGQVVLCHYEPDASGALWWASPLPAEARVTA